MALFGTGPLAPAELDLVCSGAIHDVGFERTSMRFDAWRGSRRMDLRYMKVGTAAARTSRMRPASLRPGVEARLPGSDRPPARVPVDSAAPQLLIKLSRWDRQPWA